MRHSYANAAWITDEAGKILRNDEKDDDKIHRLWVTLSYMRAANLAKILGDSIGNTVYSGPFKGMKLTPDVMTGAFAPALLGIYEHELHPTFEWVIKQPFKTILNIGCAYGYYSVGLAMRMPQVKVYSFDILPQQQAMCRDMALLNGVEDRVLVAGEFRGEDFASYDPAETLVLMDIEGAEMDLLDPAKYPALKKMTIILEMHDAFGLDISEKMAARFAPTHDVDIIRHKNIMFDLEQITGPVRYIDPLDQLLIGWENRDGPTPWAVMRPKAL